MNRMGETMSHIANPYKRSSQTLDAGQESLCAGLRRRGCRRKIEFLEQAAFCCLPSRPCYACML